MVQYNHANAIDKSEAGITGGIVRNSGIRKFRRTKIMNILPVLTLAASPATGDDFPVIPLVIVGGLAVVIAVISAIAASKKKKDDNE